MSITLYLLSSLDEKIAHGVSNLQPETNLIMINSLIGNGTTSINLISNQSVQAYMDWVNLDKPANSLTFEPT